LIKLCQNIVWVRFIEHEAPERVVWDKMPDVFVSGCRTRDTSAAAAADDDDDDEAEKWDEWETDDCDDSGHLHATPPPLNLGL